MTSTTRVEMADDNLMRMVLSLGNQKADLYPH